MEEIVKSQKSLNHRMIELEKKPVRSLSPRTNLTYLTAASQDLDG